MGDELQAKAQIKQTVGFARDASLVAHCWK
jgi:hypothetical protein